MINDDLINKLRNNKYYQEILSHVKDPIERKKIEDLSLNIHKQLLDALLPGINNTLENIDTNEKK